MHAVTEFWNPQFQSLTAPIWGLPAGKPNFIFSPFINRDLSKRREDAGGVRRRNAAMLRERLNGMLHDERDFCVDTGLKLEYTHNEDVDTEIACWLQKDGS